MGFVEDSGLSGPDWSTRHITEGPGRAIRRYGASMITNRRVPPNVLRDALSFADCHKAGRQIHRGSLDDHAVGLLNAALLKNRLPWGAELEPQWVQLGYNYDSILQAVRRIMQRLGSTNPSCRVYSYWMRQVSLG